MVDYVSVPVGDPVLAAGGGLVEANAGDLILWDSRTVHCNTPALRDDPHDSPELIRAAAHVCMTPARWAFASAISERVAAYEHSHGSSHWPHDFRQTGAAPPCVEPVSIQDAPGDIAQLVHGGRDGSLNCSVP
eukprot:FR738958.1.p1 GENE.FR738958.1~~FR738958.1.p1  ORF type:complete len:146 (+),score=5.17 FR738958.1:41-439(+)